MIKNSCLRFYFYSNSSPEVAEWFLFLGNTVLDVAVIDETFGLVGIYLYSRS